MAIIDLELSELMTIHRNLNLAAKDLNGYYKRVTQILDSLNMKVAAKDSIDDSLEYIKKYLIKESEYVLSLAAHIKTAVDSFRSQDSLAGQIPEYRFHLDSVTGAGKEEPIYSGEQPFDKIRMQIFQDAEQVLAQELSSAAVTDAVDYLNYI